MSNVVRSIQRETKRRRAKPSESEEQLLRRQYGPSSGFDTPWTKFGGGGFIFEVEATTVLSGYTGVGKTQILNQIVVHAAWQGRKVMIASLEMPMHQTTSRLVPIVLGKSDYSFQESCAATDWLDERFIYYTEVGTVKVEEVLEEFEAAHKEDGITVFVLDSLMCLGANRDWAVQEAIVAKVVTWSKRFPVHVFLVAHNGKPREGGDDLSTHNDIMGGYAIAGLADYAISQNRNRTKEREIRRYISGRGFDKWIRLEGEKYGKKAGKLRDAEIYEQRVVYEAYIDSVYLLEDATLNFSKAREGHGEGETQLWYNRGANSFGDHSGFNPNNYLEGKIFNQSKAVEEKNAKALYLDRYDRASVSAELKRLGLIDENGQSTMDFKAPPEPQPEPPAPDDDFACDLQPDDDFPF